MTQPEDPKKPFDKYATPDPFTRVKMALARMKTDQERKDAADAIMKSEREKLDRYKKEITQTEERRTKEAEKRQLQLRAPQPINIPAIIRTAHGRAIPLSKADQEFITRNSQSYASSGNVQLRDKIKTEVETKLADQLEKIAPPLTTKEKIDRFVQDRKEMMDRRGFDRSQMIKRSRDRDRGMGDD